MTEKEREALASVEATAAAGRARWFRASWFVVPLGIAAALLLIFILARPSRVPAVAELTSNGVAILTGGADVRWGPAQTPLEPGSIIAPGRIRIASGLIEIDFYSGARVTLQGPADIDVASVDHVICRQGNQRTQA